MPLEEIMENKVLRTVGFLTLAGTIVGLGYVLITHFESELETMLNAVEKTLEENEELRQFFKN